MMTINAIRNAKDARHYFEKDDYYTRDEGTQYSFWFGVGASRLGLDDNVDLDTFHALLNGTLGEHQLGRKTDTGIHHRPGWDCTFNAPKSVSILTEVFGREDIRQAHQEAVRTALTYLEKHAAQVRLTRDGTTQFVETDNLVVAAFNHTTSRNLDPHLHTHCVVMNATLTDRGWRSLSSERLLQLQKTAGAVYQNTLAHRVKKLGYDIKLNGNGTFEIAGLDEVTRKAFSTRRDDILAYMSSKGMAYTTANAQRATLNTRKAKTTVERDALRELWRGRAERLGLAPPPARPNAAEPPGESLTRSLRYAVKHLAEKDMAFSEQDIVERMLSYRLGVDTQDAIERAIDRFKREGQLLPADNHLLTTPYGVRLEEEIVRHVEKGFAAYAPFAKPAAAQALVARSHLDASQQNAVLAFSQSTDRYFGIQGFAGSGKTETLRVINSLLDKTPYRLSILAPTHVAANEMAGRLGVPAQTLDYTLTTRRFFNEEAGHRKQHEVWVIDETSFASVKKIRQLMQFAETRGARVLFVGDHRQLESIEAGRAFKLMQDVGMSFEVLDVIHRQTNPELRQAVEQAYAVRYDQVIKTLNDNVVAIPDADARHRALVAEWLSVPRKKRRHVLLLTPGNDERKAVNLLVRESLIQENTLGSTGKTYRGFENRYLSSMETRNAGFYHVGDVVRFSQNRKLSNKAHVHAREYFDVKAIDTTHNKLTLVSRTDNRTITLNPNHMAFRRGGSIEVFKQDALELRHGDRIRWTDNRNDLGLKRNDVATVLFINKHTVDVATDAGRRLTLRSNDLTHSHFTYDYASTVYGAQGQTHDYVLALADSRRLNLVNQSSFLVAISRARVQAKVYADSTAKLIKALQERTGDNTMALTQERVKEIKTKKEFRFTL